MNASVLSPIPSSSTVEVRVSMLLLKKPIRGSPLLGNFFLVLFGTKSKSFSTFMILRVIVAVRVEQDEDMLCDLSKISKILDIFSQIMKLVP